MMLSTLMLLQAGERVAGKASEEFGKMDSSGVAMFIIAITVLFAAFILLFVIFKYISRLYNTDLKNRFKKSRPGDEVPDVLEDIPGETLAAISLALYMYDQQLQGLEAAVITIKNIGKTYSPWSSKIYGLRRTPK
jgi:heme/copper-type cytochrome/quinol oxidase subunit 3